MKETDGQLRPLVSEDIPMAVEISSMGGYSDWSFESFASCFKENYCAWGISFENRIYAFLVILINLDEIEILNLGVHPLKRRQGLADCLLQYLIEFAKNQNITQIHLEVRADNIPAIMLYKKLDFQLVGRRKNYYIAKDGACDALLFSRKLAQ